MPDLGDLFRDEETRLRDEERRTRDAWIAEQTRKDALPENVARREAFNRALEDAASEDNASDEDNEDDNEDEGDSDNDT